MVEYQRKGPRRKAETIYVVLSEAQFKRWFAGRIKNEREWIQPFKLL